MNFFNTISSRLVGGLDTTTLNYINKFNVATILDPSGTNIVDYDDISYGSTVFGLNSGNTNNSFLTLENSNGAFIKTSDLLQTPFKGFSIYLKYKVRDLAGDKNHSLNASSTHRLMTTNLWPNFDNWENYTTVNPNVPDPREKPIKAQIPIQPDLPTSLFQYYSFTDELQDGTLTSFSKLEEVVPQRAIIAFVGRFSTPNTHWTTSNGPLEIQIVEPMPDACGGKLLGSGTPITAANATDDTITAIGCNSTWDNNWVTASPQYTQFTVSETDNGQPNTYYRPGYYFRYYLEGVQGVIVSLLMDSYGGHTQPDGDWHFHLASEFNSGYENCVIGYAVDGVPVMATGSTAYNESNVSLGVAQSKWIRRTDYSDPYSQDGNGYYHYDYVYDYSGNTSTGNLDHFNGAYATIDGVLTYCYFITTDYPIWPRNVRGKVINLVPDTSVFSQYGGTNSFVKLTSTHTEVEDGDNLQITVLQNGYNDLSYSITGVTSENLGGADLNGSISGLYNVLSYDIQSSLLAGTMVFSAGDFSLSIVTKQTSIVGFNAHDLSMAYSQYLYLPYLTDSGVGGSTITYSVTAPDNTTATVLEGFVNIDQSGSYTVVATKSGDGVYPDVSATCHVSLITSASDEAHLTSMPYSSVSRVHEDDTHRYFLSNFWPSFDGFHNYDYGFPQDPIPRGFYSNLVSLKLPKTPSYPATSNTCQSYYSEFGDSTEVTYDQLHDLQQQGTPGILGRMTTPNVHWSENHLPLEMVLLDPLPAACGGKFLYGTTVDIYVDSGDLSAPYYHFYLDASGTVELSNNTLDIDKKYKFQRLNNATDHHFYVSDQGGSSASSSKIHLVGNGSESGGIKGPETFVLYFNGLTTSDTLTYFCTQHSSMNATFNLESNGPETIDVSNGQSDLMTATDCFSSWDTKYITPDSNYRNFTESNDSGIYYRPGYYFKYFLDGIQNDTWTELQMDGYGGHIQPDVTVTVSGENKIYGDWHAHTSSQLFGSIDYSNCVIGYGVDGTPIMGGGSTVYDSNGVVLGIATPSWRRRVYPGEYDLTWSQDGNGFYIYDYLHDFSVSGSNLDEFNGGYARLDGVTTYAYFITQTYPIWPRNIRGAVNSIKHDEPPPSTFGMITNPGGNAVQIDNVRTDLIAGVDFTIEFFVNISSSSSGVIFGANASQWYEDMLIYYYAPSGDMLVRYYWNGGDGISMNYNGPVLSLNQWHHFAVVRHNDIASLYIDGVKKDHNSNDSSKHTMTNSTQALDSTLYLFKFWDSTYTGIIGSMASLRISKKAVYTGNFTAPTPELSTTQPSGTNIQSLVHSDVVLLVKADPLGNNNVINESQYSATITEDAGITTTLNQQI